MKKNIKYAICAATCSCALSPMISLCAEVEEKLKPAHQNFLTADADKSGGLDAKEFITFIDANAKINFGRAKEIQKRKAYDRAFSKVDKNKDKSLTWAEFVDASEK